MAPVQHFLEALSHLPKTLYSDYYYLAALLLLYILCSWIVVSSLDRPRHQLRTYFESKEENRIIKILASLPYASFTKLDTNGLRIVAWNLTMTSSQYEGIIHRDAPRGAVDPGLITKCGKYSGIFKIVAHFELPDGRVFTNTGTAFAVSVFHVLTSAHLMWHPKLGPAKKAFLYLDDRESQSRGPFRICVAVACHANPVKSRKWRKKDAKNGFCMVALAEPLDDSMVRILKCHQGPSLSCDEDGLIIGFPHDMPFGSPGKYLILSKGLVLRRKRGGGLSIEHEINTVDGNSGSPVIVNGIVVAIHSTFVEAQNINLATPVNLNGNDVEHFADVLKYLMNQHEAQPQDLQDLGEAHGGETHPGRVLRLFN